MPAISRIRLTNVIFENGGKRFNDDIYHFDGNNAVILLENGGGKTVFVQTVLQAILPHYNSEERKIRDTLSLDGDPCHIAIEWIINEKPRRYLMTAVSLFISGNKLESYKYIYEYDFQDKQGIEDIPFAIEERGGKKPASRREIADYYQNMQARNMNAKLFKTIRSYQQYIEDNYNIIPSEWRNIGLINSVEGGVEKYFENCDTVEHLLNRLLIPAIEGALSEEGKKDFPDTFEKQRERFKKHKQLRESIEESKLIAEKIEEYIKVFANYHEIDLNYFTESGHAKGLHSHIVEEKHKLDLKLEHNQAEKEKIYKNIEELNRKEASYELAVLDRESTECQQETQVALGLFYEIKNKFDINNTKYQSLKIAKEKQKLQQIEDSIANTEEQLNRLLKERNLEGIEEDIAENGALLKGEFLKEEETLISLIKEKNMELTKILDKRERKDQDLRELNREKENKESASNKKQGQMMELEKEVKRIKKDISGLDTNKDTRQQLQSWQNRIGWLEQESVNKQALLNQYKREENLLEDKQREKRTEIVKIDREKTILAEKISTMNQAHDELLIGLKTLNNSWYSYDSLYKRENTIIHHLLDKISIMNDKKEKILLQERRAGRYRDDYATSNFFTAEPLIEKWVAAWKDDYLVIETGTQYLQRAVTELQQREEDFLEIYPYWSLTIVVSDDEVKKLKQKISTSTKEMVSPVVIIGQGEGMELIKNKAALEKKMILPAHWEENLNQDTFNKWKTNTELAVRELVELRKEKEQLILEYKQQLEGVESFLNKYPYEIFVAFNNELKELEEILDDLNFQLKKDEETLTELKTKQERIMVELNNNKEETNQLNIWVRDLRLCLSKEREIEEIKIAIQSLQLIIENLNKNIVNAEYQLALINEEKKNLINAKNNNESKLKDLKNDPYYIEVEDLKAKPGQRSKYSLIEDRKNLKELLYEQEGSVKFYQQELEKDKKRRQELILDLDRAKKDCNVLIDEGLDFALYGEEGLDHFWEIINSLKPTMTEREKYYQEKQRKYDNHLAKVKIYKDNFYKKYTELDSFNIPLEQVKEVLNKEKKELEEGKNENENATKYLLREIEDISACIRVLEIENGKHNYMREGIKEASLGADFYRDFPYKRQDFVNEIKDILEKLKEAKDNANSKLDEHQRAFIIFCEEKIQNSRLKEQTVSGIRYKNNYQETIEWRDRMKKSLAHTILVAEDDMREHDKDLEQFISHLLTYLRAITTELSIIPKKTRIKVDEKWKEIFVFNIPEWKEEEGKEEIRKHIDWMINELDSFYFKTEDGTEDNAKVRKEIEKWLDIKQLLPMVLKNNEIKISCRKVTNDNKISGSLTPWESSNRWSGGEKWSKNMTLFLGILNYVAERKQGIVASSKINRTVIVDNPFGRASSNHVLDPVFYISERLGFQIIALTAHGEGSFIRNYFPVVYSCRLREATDNSTLILDKEKEIHHAFFKDKNPEFLYRLQEQEQLNLF